MVIFEGWVVREESLEKAKFFLDFGGGRGFRVVLGVGEDGSVLYGYRVGKDRGTGRVFLF